MSKASSGIKLVKWLANQADDVAASADDLKRFGPQAARVRSLLDFIPTMSDDAAKVSDAADYAADRAARNAAWGAASDAAYDSASEAADDAAREAARGANRGVAWITASDAAKEAAKEAAKDAAKDVAWNAGGAEAIGDLITPNTYRILTNPLAAGREVDRVNMNAPENVMGIIRGLSERSLIVNPRDVRSARKLADLSDYERNPVMEYINTLIENDYDGYRYPGSAYKSLEELIKSARLI